MTPKPGDPVSVAAKPKKQGTTVQVNFTAWRWLTHREAELLHRAMVKTAAEQLKHWDELDAHAEQAEGDG